MKRIPVIIALIFLFIVSLIYLYWDNNRISKNSTLPVVTASPMTVAPSITAMIPTPPAGKSVLLLIPDQTSPAIKTLVDGAMASATEAGIHLQIEEYRSDQNLLFSKADTAIIEGSQALIIYATESTSLQSVLSKASRDGIPVITLQAPASIKSSANITFDFENGATQAARLLCKAIRNQGEFAVLVAEDDPRAESIVQYFLDNVKANCPDAIAKSVKSIKNSAADAQLAFSVLLAQNADIEAVFATNSDLLSGASTASLQAGRPGLAMIGFDDGETLSKSINAGKITALITTPWRELGATAIKTAIALNHGDKVSGQIVLPIRAITSDPGLNLPPDSTAKKIKIGIILPDVDPPFYNQVFQGLRIPAFALDGVKLDVYSLQGKPENLLKDIELLINKKVSVMVIASTDPAGVNAAIKRANQAGIPIFIIGVKPTGGQVVTYFGADEYSAGYQAAAFLCKSLNGNGKIIELSESPADDEIIQRKRGFSDVMQSNCPAIETTKITGLTDDRQANVQKIAQALNQQSGMIGIFGYSDEITLAAFQAIEQTGVKGITPIGGSGLPETLRLVRDGKLAATLGWMSKDMGQLSMETVLEYLYGHEVRSEMLFPYGIITSQNIPD
jgi:ribose transport system substrate-binding protein